MTTKHWIDYADTAVRQIDGGPVYTYRTAHKALDADGSPRAYHPEPGKGLDDSRNAGYPHKSWRGVLAFDPADHSKPYIQPDGPHAGYFVGKTSLRSQHGADIDPTTYVDSETVPYIVFPGNFYAIKGTGRYGDLVMARTANRTFESAAIVADGGPAKAPLGEMSLALATALGGTNPNPRNGAGSPQGELQYVVFPGAAAAPPWPRDAAEIRQTAKALLAAIGGWPDS